jgi:DNA-binding CsgD family transcriptional regulator
LHGRDNELAILREAATAARAGEGQLVTVSGLAGSGKSALIDEFLDEIAGGFIVVRVGLSRAEAALAWAGLHVLCGEVPDGDFQHLSPGLRSAIPAALGRLDSHSDDPARVAFALVELIGRWSRERPVALVLDDVHWLDTATAGALAFAIRAGASRRQLTVLAFRPDEDLPLDPRRLLPVEACHELVLGGLSLGPLRHVLDEQCGLDLTRAQLTRVHAATDGLPLHAIEVGHLLAAGVELNTALVPPSARVMISQRLDDLPAEVVLASQVAALLARPTVDAVNAVLCSLDATIDASSAFDEAERRRIAAVRDGAVVFEHPLVPAVLRERLTSRERSDLERTVSHFVDDPDERLLLLASAATQPDEALATALADAGERALTQAAPSVAVERFELAARVTPPDDSVFAGRRLLRAADAANDADDPVAALELVDRAEVLLVDADDRLACGLVRMLALAGCGELDDSSAVGEQLLESMPSTTADLWRVHDLLAQILVFSDLDRARHHVERAVPAGDSTAQRRVRGLRERIDYLAGRPVDLDAIAAMGASGDARLVGHVAEILTWANRLDDARVAAEHELELGRHDGVVRRIQNAYDALGDVHARRGDWDTALDYLARWDELNEIVGGVDGSTRLGDAAAIHATRGEIDLARRLTVNALAIGTRTPMEAVHLHSKACYVMWCCGEPAAAVEHGRSARASAALVGYRDLSGAPFRAELVEALVATSEVAEADEVAQEHQALAERAGFTFGLASAARSRGLVESATGNVRGAVALFEQAASLNRSLGLPVERGRDLLALGGAWRRAGHRAKAAAVLAEGREVFERLGAVVWVERIDAEVDRLGGHRSGRADALTPTERRVVDLVVAGRTNSEVAAELSVSRRTVESNLTRVYRKLGVRSRTGLVASIATSARPGSSTD